jgi:hypothetical protein
MEKFKKKEIIVYYSPSNTEDKNNDWDILYYAPERLFDRLKPKFTKEPASFMACPASKQLTKNTFVIVNSVDSSYSLQENEVIPLTKTYISARYEHNPALKNQKVLALSNYWLFFTEEDSLEINFTAPYFEHAPHLQYGAVVPGRYDIGKWYRNLIAEFNIWENVNEFHIGYEEPMAYITFNTNIPVKMVRYSMTEKLGNIATTLSNSGAWEPNKPLSWRYSRFKKSNMKSLILNEIKKNIIGDDL